MTCAAAYFAASRQTILLLLLVALLSPCEAYALVTLGAPGRNLHRPTGALAESGWQYQGKWGGFLGTAIGPYHFLTAKHVGGKLGDHFTLDGEDFKTVQSVPIQGCDLAVWRVDRPLPRWATLYEDGEEVDKRIVAFGRGTPPVAPVTVRGEWRGWRCASGDGRMSWGENVISSIIIGNGGWAEQSDLLQFSFDANGGPNECQVTGGDSGGGVFLCQAGQWMLVGVLHGGIRSYRLGGADALVCEAALIDARGLFMDMPPDHFMYINSREENPRPSVSYATRVSSYRDRIRAAMEVPPAPLLLREWRTAVTLGGLALFSTCALLPFRVIARRRRLKAIEEIRARNDGVGVLPDIS